MSDSLSDANVPDGWLASSRLRTGGSGDSPNTNQVYRFRIPATSAGQTYSSGTNFMSIGSNSTYTNSTGNWQVSRVNPDLGAECGLSVALLLDVSGSVGTAEALPTLKAGADAVVDALTGTPSRMAVFNFAATSPRSGATNYPTLQSVRTEADATAFKALYAGLTTGGGNQLGPGPVGGGKW